MPAFRDFLTHLLDQGRIIFHASKGPRDQPTERDLAILAEAFDAHVLSVAGPRIAFDPATALEAADLVRRIELGPGQSRRAAGRPQAADPDVRAAANAIAALVGRPPTPIPPANPQPGAAQSTPPIR